MPRFLEKMKFILDRYGFDGVYCDGLCANIDGAYEAARRIRQMIGNQGVLYVHCTILPLQKIYCPFIDCYATYNPARREPTPWAASIPLAGWSAATTSATPSGRSVTIQAGSTPKQSTVCYRSTPACHTGCRRAHPPS